MINKIFKHYFWILFLVISFCSCSTGPVTVYVSPDGDDTNPGSEQQPFATIEKAKNEVRLLKEKNPKKDITVFLRGGEYRLQKTIVFTPDDSGNPGQTITYAAFKSETPVISADVPITDWKKLIEFPDDLPLEARGNVWVSDVSFIREIIKRQTSSPTVATQTQRSQLFYTLYNSGKPLWRARGERFSMEITELTDRSDKSTFFFPEGALKNWPDIYNAELAIIPLRKWVSNILPVEQINETTGTGLTAVPGTYTLIKHYENPENGVAHVENVAAVLDQPGEWILDSRNNKLYLWPENGKPGNNIIVPVLTELLRVEGKINYEGASDLPVANLGFRGLTFTMGDRFIFEGKTGWGVQHDWERFDSPSAMVRFRGSENCTVLDCHFTTAGSSGLRFDLYSQNNHVEGNHFEHLGAVGILLAGYGPGTKDVNRNNTIANNNIHNIGELYHGSPGIFIWQSGHNKISNNLIYNTPYTGICVTGRIVWDTLGVEECSRTIRWHEVGGKSIAGGFSDRASTWHEREKYLHSRKNIVSRNDIHDVMQICGDGNCIYISGAGGGNEIVENYCHHSPSFRINSAIRCDDDQEETVIKRNIIFRIGGNAEGLLIKGKNDLIENLLIDLKTVEGHRGYLRFYDGDVHGSVIQRNVFYSAMEDQNAFRIGVSKRGGEAPDLKDTKADYNIYFSTIDPEWGNSHLQGYQKFGVETHSISTDPMFVDIETENFQFQPGSPALKLGLKQPVKVSLTGPQGEYRNQFYTN